jgi:hypothetical protein
MTNFMDRSGGNYNIISGITLTDQTIALINTASINATLNPQVLTARDFAFMQEFSWQYTRNNPERLWMVCDTGEYTIMWDHDFFRVTGYGPTCLSIDGGTYRYYRGEYVERIPGNVLYKIARRVL